MRPKHDIPGEFLTAEPGTPPTDQDLGSSGEGRGAGPFTGGYYWLPTPRPDGVTWAVVTCRDLGCGADAGHDADLWPCLMAPLAEVWGREAQILRRRLRLCYTGLPRGRVTRPGGTFLILHGNDSPSARWAEMVITAFHLAGYEPKLLFDEHETQISGHPQQVAAAIGLMTG